MFESWRVKKQFQKATEDHDVASFMRIWGNRNLAKEAAAILTKADQGFLRNLADAISDNSYTTEERGLAAHALMRAIDLESQIGNDAHIQTVLQKATDDIDFFVRENAKHALETLYRDSEKASIAASTPKKSGEPKPTGIVPGHRSDTGGYYCPYCGASNYEPHPDFSSVNRRCRECKTIFSTMKLND